MQIVRIYTASSIHLTSALLEWQSNFNKWVETSLRRRVEMRNDGTEAGKPPGSDQGVEWAGMIDWYRDQAFLKKQQKPRRSEMSYQYQLTGNQCGWRRQNRYHHYRTADLEVAALEVGDDMAVTVGVIDFKRDFEYDEALGRDNKQALIEAKPIGDRCTLAVVPKAGACRNGRSEPLGCIGGRARRI